MSLFLADAPPPLDFSGVWALDENASRGVSKHSRRSASRGAVGYHIRISPVGRGRKLLGEEIIADGRPYEKALGPGRGVVTAARREARLVFRKRERPKPNARDLKYLRGAETRRHSLFSVGD